VPVMLYDAKLSQTMADELLKKGIYVIDSFPCSTKRKQELEYNCQRHIQRAFDKAINAFIAVGQSLKLYN
jgi:glycine C-acetyltransferase